jgi:hypothetical protein
MGAACEVARRIGCKVYEIPATAEVTYYPRPKKAYAIHNPHDQSIGYVVFDGESITMDCLDYSDADSGFCCSLSLLNWQEVRDRDFCRLLEFKLFDHQKVNRNVKESNNVFNTKIEIYDLSCRECVTNSHSPPQNLNRRK